MSSGDVDELEKDVFFTLLETANRMEACYEDGLGRDPTLEGYVPVNLVYDGLGNVTDVKREPGTLKDDAVVACALAVIRTTRFPASKHDVSARTHLHFSLE